MKLKELLQDIPNISDLPDIEVTNICCDSRRVSQGSLFFALPGNVVDGSQFIAAAAKGGAVAITHEAEQCPTLDIPSIRVQDARIALAKAASRFFLFPSEGFYLCGITGTNGKTTLTYILEQIWSEQASGIIGTVNFRFNDKTLPAPNTTPDAITIQELLRNMADENVSHVAMEVSSHGLTQKRTTGCSFNAAVFTNLTQDHLDYHTDMEDYFQAKKTLFTQELKESPKQNKLAIIDIDDPYGARLKNEISNLGYKIKTYSFKNNESDIFLVNAKYSLKETSAEISYNGNTYNLVTSLLGEFNLKNIMASLLVGEHSGSDISEMIEKIRTIHVPGRLDRVKKSNFFVDYAHTPDALKNVLTALKNIMAAEKNTGRLIAVLGCGGDRDQGKRPLMGEAAAKLADIVVITSDNPRTEDPDKIISEITPGVVKHKKAFDNKTGYLIQADRQKALKKAAELAEPHDVILVAGKGHEDYQIIGTKKIHFDDKEILEQLV